MGKGLKIVLLISISLVVLGVALRILDTSLDNLSIFFGLIGVASFHTINIIVNKETRRRNELTLSIMIILMSFSLFSKYLYHSFGDFPSLVIIPLFVVTAIFYLFTKGKNSLLLSWNSAIYLALTVPIFFTGSNRFVSGFIPYDLKSKYADTKTIATPIIYDFKNENAEKLYYEGTSLMKKNQNIKSIIKYKEARELDPKNPQILMNLSNSYARLDNFEQAFKTINEAILYDSTNPALYNNRGLWHYKLANDNKAIENFLRGIQLDSTQSYLHANLALAYYDQGNISKSCKSLDKALSLGFNLKPHKKLTSIKNEKCN